MVSNPGAVAVVCPRKGDTGFEHPIDRVSLVKSRVRPLPIIELSRGSPFVSSNPTPIPVHSPISQSL